MDMHKATQKHYLASKQVKKLLVRKHGDKNLLPLHQELVEISPTTCSFEKEGRQEFRVGEEVDFIFDTGNYCLSARASIAWVTKYEHIDEGYEHIVWFSYGAEFSGELNGDFFKRIKGDFKGNERGYMSTPGVTPGVLPDRLRDRIWLAQQFWHYWSMFLGSIQGVCNPPTVNRFIILPVSVFMICFPIIITLYFYRKGIIYVSPHLLLTMIAGLFGIGLSRYKEKA